MNLNFEFEFHIDEEVSVWKRHHYRVKANSYEEAVKIMIKEVNEMNLGKEHQSSEFLLDDVTYLEDRPKELWFKKETENELIGYA